MIYVFYSHLEFKRTIQKLIENIRRGVGRRQESTKITANTKITYVYINQDLDQLIMSILDNATGFILEFAENNRKRFIALLATLKIMNIPGIVTSLQLQSPVNKLLTKALKSYIPIKDLKSNPDKLKHIIYGVSPHTPITELDVYEDFINIDYPQHASIFYIFPKRYDKTKPALIFTHGITARATTYVKLLKRLEQYYNIFALDMPYHGKSSTLPVYPKSLEEYAKVVTEAIQKIIINHKLQKNKKGIHLMGHSLGGAIMFYAAQQLASNKYNISHLILLNPAGGPIKENITKLIYLTTVYKILNINKYYVLNDDLKRIIMEVLMNHLKNLNTRTPKMVKNFSKIIPKGFKDFSRIKIDIPTTLVFSDSDAYFSCEYKYTYSQRFSNLNLIEVKGSHDWPVIRPPYIENIIQHALKNTSKLKPKRNLLQKLFCWD